MHSSNLPLQHVPIVPACKYITAYIITIIIIEMLENHVEC